MIIATALGLAAAFLFALSGFLQQRAARETVGGHTVSLKEPSEVKTLARRLPRSRTWLRGWLANLAGWFSQAAALQVGSVAAVQPLMSTQLLFVPAAAMRKVLQEMADADAAQRPGITARYSSG